MIKTKENTMLKKITRDIARIGLKSLQNRPSGQREYFIQWTDFFSNAYINLQNTYDSFQPKHRFIFYALTVSF